MILGQNLKKISKITSNKKALIAQCNPRSIVRNLTLLSLLLIWSIVLQVRKQELKWFWRWNPSRWDCSCLKYLFKINQKDTIKVAFLLTYFMLILRFYTPWKRQKTRSFQCESQNESNKKAKHAKFSEKRTFLTPRGEKCSIFGEFGVLCFLVTPVLRFAVLLYHRRNIQMT